MSSTIIAALALISAIALPRAQDFSAEDLACRTTERRAVETVIWGMPAVNTDLMLQATIGRAKGKPNQIVYWSRLPDWKNQTLTPNPDVIYLMPFFNTKDAGPTVLEIPPADDGVINGTVMDVWQVPLEDAGPAGVDKGKGGKYLVLPPSHSAAVPDGYIALPSMNYQGYALLRSILKSGSDADIAKAVAYAKRIKLYPLSQAANPPMTTFAEAIDVVYDSTIHVQGWRSRELELEAGRVRGKIVKVHKRAVDYKGHIHRATPDEPQYEIKSDKTDHVALHKAGVLRRLG
jgi:hypothetical protein